MSDPHSKTTISFEFFPPKNDEGREALVRAAKALAPLNPEFLTVTFGAGGSTKSGTFETAKLLKTLEIGPVGAHLSYFGTPKTELMAYADELWNSGIRHLVALRGDIPPELRGAKLKEPDYFEYTSEFVEALLSRHPFDISVGAYPDKHPDAPSLEADLIALKKKCDAGAARAITQFFFDVDKFYDFLSKAREMGIATPVATGILPIADFAKVQSFAAKCQASLPPDFSKRFEGHDPVAVGIEIGSEMINNLKLNGIRHFHFYTLNKSDMILDICRRTGLAE